MNKVKMKLDDITNKLNICRRKDMQRLITVIELNHKPEKDRQVKQEEKRGKKW